jgi:hypothetical protein
MVCWWTVTQTAATVLSVATPFNELRHDRWISQGRRIAQAVELVFGDLSQDPPHNFS